MNRILQALSGHRELFLNKTPMEMAEELRCCTQLQRSLLLKHWVGKWLRIEGEVKQVDQGIIGFIPRRWQPVLVDVGAEPYPIRCCFSSTTGGWFEKVNRGDWIELEGCVYSFDYFYGPSLRDCRRIIRGPALGGVILEKGGINPGPRSPRPSPPPVQRPDP